MKTTLERPVNPERSLRPANFHRLVGYTVNELADEVNGLLASGRWKSKKYPQVDSATVYNWENKTGWRMDRVCSVCKNRRGHKQMRGAPYGDTCYDCPPKKPSSTLGNIRFSGKRNIQMTHEDIERDMDAYISGGGTITHCPPPLDPKHPSTAETFGTHRYRRPD